MATISHTNQSPNIETSLDIIPKEVISNNIFSELVPKDKVHFSRVSSTYHRIFKDYDLSKRIEATLDFLGRTDLINRIGDVRYGDYKAYKAIWKKATKNLLIMDSSTESKGIFFHLFNLLTLGATEVKVIEKSPNYRPSHLIDLTYRHLNELLSAVYKIADKHEKRAQDQTVAAFTASYVNDYYWSDFWQSERSKFQPIPSNELENALWELFTQRFGPEAVAIEEFKPLVKQIVQLEIGYLKTQHSALPHNLPLIEKTIAKTFQYLKPLYRISYQSCIKAEKGRKKKELLHKRWAWRLYNRDLPLLGKAAIAINAVAIADLLFNALTPGNLTDAYQAPAYYTCISIFGFGTYRAINYLREKIPKQFINRDLRPAALITSFALAVPVAVLTGRILTNLGAESGLLIYPSQGIIGTAWAIVQLRVFSNWMFY